MVQVCPAASPRGWFHTLGETVSGSHCGRLCRSCMTFSRKKAVWLFVKLKSSFATCEFSLMGAGALKRNPRCSIHHLVRSHLPDTWPRLLPERPARSDLCRLQDMGPDLPESCSRMIARCCCRRCPGSTGI